ncbi:hypothetical protein [Xylophilus sp. GOD-11R]|uniref:hypothetical protein n=1 Tax=Xylophilus sp. GOD-11R TaxID=3089814 RepID=UPI00298D2A9F|nr:hypothetical protein [Xylophilus sp. GOD-11R]WPB57260.1 hypothetical protein R9X41_00965 [Xylophilus sp. GOD-11R]
MKAPSSTGTNTRHAVGACAGLLLLAIAYLAYVHRQNADVFFESQFLHIEFLRQLVEHRLTAQGFFTAFGEHIFPGYNLILAANYQLFHVWGGFDSLVHGAAIVLTAMLVVACIWRRSDLPASRKLGSTMLAALLLLSTTNNPQWGMALAATVGVLLFTLGAIQISAAFGTGHRTLSPWLYLVLPACNILFLGGYAVGSIGACTVLVLVHVWQCRAIGRKDLQVAATVGLSLAIYIALVTRYGTLTANKPESLGLHIGEILQFAVLMTGASVMGKAFYEGSHTLLPYYVLGSVLIVASICLCVEYVRRRDNLRLLLLALLVYSATTILAVAFFRYRNGLDGALGQWYNAHTHFVGVAVGFYLVEKLGARQKATRLLSGAALVLLSICALAGYAADWRKAPYVAAYKLRFADQATAILAYPESLKDRRDPWQTMLWDYSVVKPGIDFLYAHKLWIFSSAQPTVSGVTSDDWLLADAPMSVLCPAGSRSVRFRSWRPEDWTPSVLEVHAGSSTQDLPVINGEARIELPGAGVAAALVDGSRSIRSRPMSVKGDQRRLVAKIEDIRCAMD